MIPDHIVVVTAPANGRRHTTYHGPFLYDDAFALSESIEVAVDAGAAPASTVVAIRPLVTGIEVAA